VIHGYDAQRGLFVAHDFSAISLRLRKENRSESGEILSRVEEGKGESRKRLARIEREARRELGPEWIGKGAGSRFPLAVLVYPEGSEDKIETALGKPIGALDRTSEAFLASLTALAYIDIAHPRKAMELAYNASRTTRNPYPRYAGYLAYRQWNERRDNINSRLPLESEFDDLARLERFFERSRIQNFAERCDNAFFGNVDPLPQRVVDMYLDGFYGKS
jgi:hypothetical protein